MIRYVAISASQPSRSLMAFVYFSIRRLRSAFWSNQSSRQPKRRRSRSVPCASASTFVPGDETSIHVRLLPQSARPTISDQQIWLIAIGVIAVDILLAMVPIVPFLAAYVLIVRAGWFKDFIDDVYDRSYRITERPSDRRWATVQRCST